jgi:hypothetical protein
MAVGRVTAGILPRAKRGEERSRHAPTFGAALWTRIVRTLFRCGVRQDYGLFLPPTLSLSFRAFLFYPFAF